MNKNIVKALGIFILVFFAMSMTGEASKCTPCKAKADIYDLSSSRNHGNVLSNDIGEDVKIVGTSKPINGGKVTMYSKGEFYYKPASSSKTTIHDRFTYTIENKCGQKSTAKVTINYKFNSKNSIDSSETPAKDPVFVTVHPHEGNTYWVGEDGHRISLKNNNSAINPTYRQLLTFIKKDKTDERRYTPGKYTCGDFAETVHNNAEKKGYKAGWVTIEGIDHCCNAFQTSDKGMVYIDCTGSPEGGESHDTTVKLKDGIEYQPVSLYNKDIQFYSMGTVTSFRVYW
jgi:hypothetical protein